MFEATLFACTERIHRAAMDRREWSGALEMIADLVDGVGVTLLRSDAGGGLIPLGEARTDDDSLALLLDRYSDPASNPGLQLMMAQPPCTLLLPQHLGHDNPFYHSDLYHTMYRARGIEPGAATMLLNGATSVGFALNRPVSKGPLDETETSLLEWIVRHLRLAICVEMRLARLGAERSGLIQALDRLPTGVLLVDAIGAVVIANRSAETLIASGDGLSVAGGRLRGARPSETAALRALIHAAIADHVLPAPGGALQLARPSGRRPLSVVIAPLRLDPIAGPGSPAAIVFVEDPDRMPSSLPDDLTRLFGLSPREALLTMHLIEGRTLVEAAERMDVGRETARTYLKRIFHKTDTHRQSELLRVVLTGLAGLHDGARPPLATEV